MGRKKNADLTQEIDLESLVLEATEDMEDLELQAESDSETTESKESKEDSKEESTQEAAAEEPKKPARKRKPRKRKNTTLSLNTETVETGTAETKDEIDHVLKAADQPPAQNTPAIPPSIKAPSFPPEPPPVGDKTSEQIQQIFTQWEATNKALLSQLEKFEQKIPNPSMKSAMSWAPLARISIAASVVAILLSGLSLVFSHSVRQQILETAENPVNMTARAVKHIEARRTQADRALEQELALGNLAPSAIREQNEVSPFKKPIAHSSVKKNKSR